MTGEPELFRRGQHCLLGSAAWQTAPHPCLEALVAQGFQQKGMLHSPAHQKTLETGAWEPLGVES